jgi:hypothetical protein
MMGMLSAPFIGFPCIRFYGSMFGTEHRVQATEHRKILVCKRSGLCSVILIMRDSLAAKISKVSKLSKQLADRSSVYRISR